MKLPHDWIAPEWPAPSCVRALITTRHGGTSRGRYASLNLAGHTGDDAVTVRANRRRVRAWLPAEPKWLNQVHGNHVINADTLDTVTEADAAVARMANTVCAVMMADCLPVLLCDLDGTAVGVAHAGWRGLAAGVIENTVRAMGCPPPQLLAYLGPAIGAHVFEVGAEVRERFIEHDPRAEQAFVPCDRDKWHADLRALARQRLTMAGVSRIHGEALCTASDARRFYSHRREGPTGRMAALIWLVSGPNV